jgi:hypothetical protein
MKKLDAIGATRAWADGAAVPFTYPASRYVDAPAARRRRCRGGCKPHWHRLRCYDMQHAPVLLVEHARDGDEILPLGRSDHGRKLAI